MRKKKLEKIECEICGNNNKEVLHGHHIIERTEKNTTNHDYNIAIICGNCHSLVHSDIIKIIGIYPSTKLPYGRTVIYIKDGVSNCPEITEPYYSPQLKQMKIHRKKND